MAPCLSNNGQISSKLCYYVYAMVVGSFLPHFKRIITIAIVRKWRKTVTLSSKPFPTEQHYFVRIGGHETNLCDKLSYNTAMPLLFLDDFAIKNNYMIL